MVGPPRLRLGVSACLLGERVRWDGGHKRDAFLTDVLGAHVDWVAVCPEVELGLGVPRPTLRLEGRAAAPRLVQEASGEDFTTRMRAYANARVRELERLELDGYVLKRASPSCGLHGVPVHRSRGAPRAGRGLFAAALVAALPGLPMEEEGRLAEPRVRARFLERVLARARRRLLRAARRNGRQTA
jgi:uncharacterized protein YbbK (DUF523 family)